MLLLSGSGRHRSVRLGQQADFVGVGVHHVREPDVVAGPAEALQVGERAHTELLLAEAVLVDGFGQVGMQSDARMAPRQLGGVAHQVRGYAER